MMCGSIVAIDGKAIHAFISILIVECNATVILHLFTEVELQIVFKGIGQLKTSPLIIKICDNSISCLA